MMRVIKLGSGLLGVFVMSVIWADWSQSIGVPVDRQAAWMRHGLTAVATWSGSQALLGWLASGGTWIAANPGPMLGGGAGFAMWLLGRKRRHPEPARADDRLDELLDRLEARLEQRGSSHANQS